MERTDDRRARIDHVITRLELGGAQQNTLYCAGRHDRRKYRVGVIAGRGGILDDEALGLPNTDVFLLDTLKHPLSPLWDIGALFALWRLFRRRRTALVHTHSSKAGIVGRWAAHLAGVPVIVHTIHGWSFNRFQPRPTRALYTWLEKVTAPLTTAFVAVAESDVALGIERGIGERSRYRVIRSGIELGEFRDAAHLDPASIRAELGLDPRRPVVGMVACFKAQKAPVDFVEAAHRVAARLPGTQFIMAGDGALRGDVERRLAHLDFAASVKLLGWRRDVPRVMRAMDIVVLTSLWEGLPRVVPQAFCCGRPVVATAVNGTVEVVRHGVNGFLVPPGDPERAARRIIDMLQDPALLQRMSAEAARTIGPASEFDADTMVTRLEAVYADLLEIRGHNT